MTEDFTQLRNNILKSSHHRSGPPLPSSLIDEILELPFREHILRVTQLLAACFAFLPRESLLLE